MDYAGSEERKRRRWEGAKVWETTGVSLRSSRRVDVIGDGRCGRSGVIPTRVLAR